MLVIGLATFGGGMALYVGSPNDFICLVPAGVLCVALPVFYQVRPHYIHTYGMVAPPYYYYPPPPHHDNIRLTDAMNFTIFTIIFILSFHLHSIFDIIISSSINYQFPSRYNRACSRSTPR